MPAEQARQNASDGSFACALRSHQQEDFLKPRIAAKDVPHARAADAAFVARACGNSVILEVPQRRCLRGPSRRRSYWTPEQTPRGRLQRRGVASEALCQALRVRGYARFSRHLGMSSSSSKRSISTRREPPSLPRPAGKLTTDKWPAFISRSIASTEQPA